MIKINVKEILKTERELNPGPLTSQSDSLTNKKSRTLYDWCYIVIMTC